MDKNRYSMYGIQIQEWLALKHGIKPLLRTVIQPDDVKNIEKLCREDGLFYIVKPFSQLYLTKFDSPVNVIYISKNKDLLERAYQSEKSGSGSLGARKIVGELLGYPSCCVEFYSEFFSQPYLKDTKFSIPIKTYSKTQGKPSFLVNNIFKLESRLSSKGLEEYQKNPDFADRVSHLFLISHVPCSYTCKESIKMGREMLDLLEKEEPELAKEIVFRLKRPLLYFDDFNWLIFNGRVNGNTINYTSILPPLSLMPEGLVKKFREGSEVKVGKEFVDIFKNKERVHRIKKKDKDNGILFNFS
ncbi:MAG: hypothetical protein GTN76_07700 [Candidatus Aenigmarchaeota archaeon]|nr:hypothetical protein [Candidatus Aenigmarchaeota archaeon]